MNQPNPNSFSRPVNGRALNRMIEVWDWDQPWADRYLAVRERRRAALQRALEVLFAVHGFVLENGFGGWRVRMPGLSPDGHLGENALAELLSRRCLGFGFDLRLMR